MKRKIFVICCFISISILSYSQNQEVWLLMKSHNEISYDRNDIVVHDNSLINTLSYFNIDSLFKVFPHSRNDTLQRLYGFIASSDNFQDIIHGLRNLENIEDVHIKEEEEIVSLYDPSDWMWYLTTLNPRGWLWHLKNIQADLAWDITKGDPSIKIAIIDTWFDINHPDLYNQLLYHYDLYDNKPFYSSGTINNHGTTVASFAAAETDGGGQLASVGFNCKIIPYKAHAGNYLQRAQHASLVMNADVLTSSAGGWYCPKYLDFDTYEGIAVREILNNGTVIVMGAGNGFNSSPKSHCWDLVNNQHQPWRPFHPYYDERIIIVTSTDVDDKHYYFNQSTNTDKTHSHYPYVDICAPGYDITGATSTLKADGTPNTWPYYAFCTGTSYATPIVAGVCGLLKSINKCFTPEDIQYIIKMTADPVVDGIFYPGQLGAGRINAYNAVQMAQSYLADIHVNNSQTWANSRNIYSDIIIENGATLSITSTIKMADNCKITIQPGSKLIVDGGTLTNSCPGQMWRGIFVAGNAYQPQTAQYQGIIELKNGAVIENARKAIGTYGLTPTGDVDWNTTGGIIYADNTTFKNNCRSAEFMEYPKPGLGLIPQSASYFKNCTFTLDDSNLFTSGNANLLNQISMWAVTGVKINGCKFENNITSLPDRKSAIYTIDGGYTVDEHCSSHYNANCVCNNSPDSSVFTGFHSAIASAYLGKPYVIKVDRSKFNNNYYGILLSGLSNTQLYNLEMSLGANCTGIYLDGCTGYKVELNKIQGDGSSTGILVNNAGTDENKIGRNTINNTRNGIHVIAPQNNRGPIATGLQLLSNEFTNNTNDIHVGLYGIVRLSQGSPSCSADNLFGPTATYNYLVSNINQLVNYYYDHTIPRKEPVYRSRAVSIFSAPSCSYSTSWCGGVINGKSGVESSESQLAQYRELNKQYAEMMRIFYEKGYDKILNEYYNGTVENEELLKEAMQYQEEILAVTEIMAEISNEALINLKTDSIINLYQIRDWYDEIYNLSAKYSLAETYYQLGKFDEGFKTLTLIPEMYKLNENEVIEHLNYVSLFTFKNKVRESGRTIAELNEEEIEQLLYFASVSKGLSSLMAQGILCFFYEICIEDEVSGERYVVSGDEGERRNAEEQKSENAEDSYGLMVLRSYGLENIKIFPNPTTGELTISNYELRITGVEVFDIYGRKQNVKFNSYDLTVIRSYGLSNFPAGIYFIKIITDLGEITKKIVKQ